MLLVFHTKKKPRCMGHISSNLTGLRGEIVKYLRELDHQQPRQTFYTHISLISNWRKVYYHHLIILQFGENTRYYHQIIDNLWWPLAQLGTICGWVTETGPKALAMTTGSRSLVVWVRTHHTLHVYVHTNSCRHSSLQRSMLTFTKKQVIITNPFN